MFSLPLFLLYKKGEKKLSITVSWVQILGSHTSKPTYFYDNTSIGSQICPNHKSCHSFLLKSDEPVCPLLSYLIPKVT
jgi:hypothetical protein